ncbi:hypothetical protein KIN20_036369 [Parelaphostrongylus tenuis]|uniref:Uncharacterized protein n=1 Tax=Parelaphostrongylus tenuis TaxID=148309 RepID=A0AAD5RCG9_PARTN|nr:hypothetical protein KIN20_036369 [Parelaphostrongylus tenuis]
MSRDTSHSASGEVSIPIPDDNPNAEGGGYCERLSFSTPMTASVPPIEIEIEDFDADRDKKWTRKLVEDQKSKRKDTATSFSHFLHRFTRSDDKKEDKPKPVLCEEGGVLQRPDKLLISDSVDDWFEMKTIGMNGFGAPSDIGYESGAPLYEWKAGSLEESLVTESNPAHRELLRVEHSDPDLDDLEHSMLKLLEEFRNGQMRALTDEQMEKMRTMKREHEEVTNLHLALYNLDKSGCEKSEEELDKMYDKLSQKLLSMHNCVGAFAHSD